MPTLQTLRRILTLIGGHRWDGVLSAYARNVKLRQFEQPSSNGFRRLIPIYGPVNELSGLPQNVVEVFGADAYAKLCGSPQMNNGASFAELMWGISFASKVFKVYCFPYPERYSAFVVFELVWSGAASRPQNIESHPKVVEELTRLTMFMQQYSMDSIGEPVKDKKDPRNGINGVFGGIPKWFGEWSNLMFNPLGMRELPILSANTLPKWPHAQNTSLGSAGLVEPRSIKELKEKKRFVFRPGARPLVA